MIRSRLFVDDAVGETRRLLADVEGKAFRLDLERWSERQSRARVGELWSARVLDPAGDGDWFVDLGSAGQGMLRPGKAKRLAVGQHVLARVRAEAQGDKGAVLELAKGAQAADGPPRRLEAPDTDAFFRGIELVDTIEGAGARSAISAAIEEGLADSVDLACGGRLWVEATRAVTAIDVDRSVGRSKAQVMNLEAAGEAGRQLSLRSIGGVIVVDFIGAPRGVGASELSDAFCDAYQRWGAAGADSLGLSRFGLLQASLPRGRRSLAAALNCGADEREALDALRALESLGWSERSARLEVSLTAEAERWLRSSLPDWEERLGGRIGRRWRVAVGPVRDDQSAVRIVE